MTFLPCTAGLRLMFLALRNRQASSAPIAGDRMFPLLSRDIKSNASHGMCLLSTRFPPLLVKTAQLWSLQHRWIRSRTQSQHCTYTQLFALFLLCCSTTHSGNSWHSYSCGITFITDLGFNASHITVQQFSLVHVGVTHQLSTCGIPDTHCRSLCYIICRRFPDIFSQIVLTNLCSRTVFILVICMDDDNLPLNHVVLLFLNYMNFNPYRPRS